MFPGEYHPNGWFSIAWLIFPGVAAATHPVFTEAWKPVVDGIEFRLEHLSGIQE